MKYPPLKLGRLFATSLFCLAACGGEAGPTAPVQPPPDPPSPPPAPGPQIDRILDQVPVDPGGGTLRVSAPDSPFDGLTIDVPSESYTSTTIWTIGEVPDVRVTLPSPLRQLGPTLHIENGVGYADVPFVVTLPIQVPSDTSVAAFYRDPVSGALEMIPVVAQTDSTLILLTRHVSADVMMQSDGAGGGSNQAGSARVPGQVQVVLVGAGTVNLQVLTRTGFAPGVDDWEFKNLGSTIATGGYCAGSAMSAIHHFYTRKAARGALNSLYDSIPNFGHDNPLGIRLASVVQTATNWRDHRSRVIAQMLQATAGSAGVSLGGPAWAQRQLNTLAMAMLATGQPQLLTIYRSDFTAGHAIVAQAVQQNRVFVSDPNQPGVERTILADASGIVPFNFSANANIQATKYSQIFAFGISALLPMRTFDTYWQQLESQVVGDAEFPSITRQFRDPADTTWRPVTRGIKTASKRLAFRTLCSNCPWGRPPPDVADRQVTLVFDDQGRPLADDVPNQVAGADIHVGTSKFGIGLAHHALAGQGALAAYIDFSHVTIDPVPFTLTVDKPSAGPGDNVTLTVVNGGLGDSSARYRWTFGTEAPVTTSFNVPTLNRTVNTTSTFVKVELMDAAGIRLAVATLSLGGTLPFWVMTSVTDDNTFFNNDEFGTDFLPRLLTEPNAGMISLEPHAPAGTNAMFRVLPTGTWTAANCCQAPIQAPAHLEVTLGQTPRITYPFSPHFASWETNFTQTSTNLDQGTMSGSFVDGEANYHFGGMSHNAPAYAFRLINAVRTGKTLTGQVGAYTWDSPGSVLISYAFTFTFTAQRVR